jgi:hypothetical protein
MRPGRCVCVVGADVLVAFVIACAGVGTVSRRHDAWRVRVAAALAHARVHGVARRDDDDVRAEAESGRG